MIRVRRNGLIALLRAVDPGGYWSRELGIHFEGTDVPLPTENH